MMLHPESGLPVRGAAIYTQSNNALGATLDNLLHRLYRTKLALLATICTSAGIGLLFLAHWGGWRPLTAVPVADIGAALFTTGLIAVAFDYVDSRDAEQRTAQHLRAVLHEQAPVIRNSVLDGFATSPETLTRIASTQTLDQVIRNCLAARFSDAGLATDLYGDIAAHLDHTEQRHYDTRIVIDLAPWTQGPKAGEGAMFVASLRWEYRTRGLTPQQHFYCVSNPDSYRQLFRDPATAGAWHFRPTNGLTAASMEVFQLAQYAINGQPQPIKRHETPSSQQYIAEINPDVVGRPSPVTVSFTYRVLIAQHGHLLFLDFHKPSKGIQTSLTYNDDCGIHHINALDFITSPHNTRLLHSPTTLPTTSIHIGYDGWTLPKSGITYTWTLNHELHPAPPTPHRPGRRQLAEE